MYDRLRKRLEGGRQDGFTLIELLIVIVILGILAAIVVFAVGGISDKGQTSACSADRKTLQTAMEAYFAQPVAQGGGGGSYAADEAALVPKFLAEQSSLHTAVATDGPDTGTAVGDAYSITPVAPCT